MNQPARGPHWLTMTYATIYIVFYESRLFSADEIRRNFHPYDEEIGIMPEAWALIASDKESDLIQGLHLLSTHVFDWHSLGLLLGWLLENMVMGDYTIHQVMETLKVVVTDVSDGGFMYSKEVIQDFDRDPVKIDALVEIYKAVQNGQSSESLAVFQERIDEWLSCYGTV